MLLCLVLLAAGGLLVFGRRSITLDAAGGSLTSSYSLLIPIRSARRDLTGFDGVVMAFRLGDSESPDRYPIRLRAREGKDFTICSPAKFADARNQAEYLSHFLGLPLSDMTTDNELVVSPEQARQTLRERVRCGSGESTVEPPRGTRCQVTESGGKVTLVIPRRTSRVAVGFAVLVSSLTMLLFAPLLRIDFTRSGTPVWIRILFTGLVIFAFGVLPLVTTGLAFGAVRSSIIVTASAESLTIQRGGRRRRTATISAADILDVDYQTIHGIVESARHLARRPVQSPTGSAQLFQALARSLPSKGIIVKSRQGVTTFGDGLPLEELRHVKSVLIRTLAGPKDL